jgi:hypothetical protein
MRVSTRAGAAALPASLYGPRRFAAVMRTNLDMSTPFTFPLCGGEAAVVGGATPWPLDTGVDRIWHACDNVALAGWPCLRETPMGGEVKSDAHCYVQ